MPKDYKEDKMNGYSKKNSYSEEEMKKGYKSLEKPQVAVSDQQEEAFKAAKTNKKYQLCTDEE